MGHLSERSILEEAIIGYLWLPSVIWKWESSFRTYVQCFIFFTFASLHSVKWFHIWRAMSIGMLFQCASNKSQFGLYIYIFIPPFRLLWRAICRKTFVCYGQLPVPCSNILDMLWCLPIDHCLMLVFWFYWWGFRWLTHHQWKLRNPLCCFHLRINEFWLLYDH